jgi:twitching motility protein PilT
MERNASDLHLTSGRPPILRINGVLDPLPISPLTDGDMRILLHSVLSVRQRTIYELEREIDFALALDHNQRFRVNAYFQKGKMAMSLRAIPTRIPDPKELRIPNTVMKLAQYPQGLVLVVGPTGSGKSTTLACMIDHINRHRQCRILTVEDPIEFTHESKVATIDQRELFADTKSFASALKYILRQDPDVILVGEMRDLDTISAALTAAETGHLVLATLHANDAIQTIDRIIDVFPAHQQEQIRAQLSSALTAVISQRLLPNREQDGRIAAFEILVATPAARNLIREDKLHQLKSIMEASRSMGMITMDAALVELVNANLIQRDIAMIYASNPTLFVSR